MSKNQPGKGKAPLSDAEKAKSQQERQQAFKKLAVKRVNKIVKMYDGIGKLANYKPALDQAAAIERALVDAHNNAIGLLKGTAKTAGTFQL